MPSSSNSPGPYPASDQRADPLIAPEAKITDGARNDLDRFIINSGSLAAWLVFVAMSISVFEVFMRYGFDSPTSWVHESVVFVIAVCFSLGGPVALASNRHIRVRVLYDHVSPAIRIWMDRFNDLVTLCFCVVMSYAGFKMFWSASHNPMGDWQLERSGTSWNPPFPAMAKAFILLALALMTLQALLHLIESCKRSARNPEAD
ncbi:TRAP transporter small permease [Aestuariirhabdus sp. Z084]|uniref:TRAP transporter small permease subunit n=1 Tax=Aestuariirhabdus haliotis TaxID=2918751 RepID=UPI00201B445B|nr:TRAP transporter small permease [Aestuariirhabdus haliotis]MCL6417387.1 TRAP transporter small permease [Aestuariirhabdus haliotis]MCL6421317.1 TRAP transporter small permease [Aestuariirhabdus haliotis]